MILSKSEQEHFFRLIHGLQFDAIKRLSLECPASTFEAFVALPVADKALIRNAVYENPSVITEYVDENPDGLSTSDLVCVRQWTKFVKASFFVERHLKDYSIWIHDETVYAVVGLRQRQEEILPKPYLPLLVEGVILPWNGKIVFDGLLYHRSISFGGGIKRSLRETYMAAKQNGRIIASLEEPLTESAGAKALAPAKDWKKELAALEKAANCFRGETHPLHKGAITVMKASHNLVATALGESHEDIDALIDANNHLVRALNRYKKALDRADF